MRQAFQINHFTFKTFMLFFTHSCQMLMQKRSSKAFASSEGGQQEAQVSSISDFIVDIVQSIHSILDQFI